MSRIVLGVAGGIAAYKACELLRRFTEAGHQVTVVPTAAALNFVGETTWAALSGQPVQTGVFDEAHQVPHVRLGQNADLVVVAPATADLLARAATGRADDLLTNVLLTAHCPILMVPAMHTEMWQHPATTANVHTLRERGVVVLDPASGRLTGADSGPGRLPEAVDIAALADTLLEDPATAGLGARRDLSGVRLVVATGGTREHLDPVRFLGNSSSGLMGLSIARAAALRGAEVCVVAGQIDHPIPANCSVRNVVSTADLAEAMAEEAAAAEVIVMAVAAADFTPARRSGGKIKKAGAHSGLTLELVQTTDVLHTLTQRPDRPAGQIIVGFAAETAADHEELLALGRAKLQRKGCELLVLNDVTAGRVFGQPDNHVFILQAGTGGAELVAEHQGSKGSLAHRILDAVQARRGTQ